MVQLIVGGRVHEGGGIVEVAADRPTRVRVRAMDGIRYIGLNPAVLVNAAKGRVTLQRSGEWGYAYGNSVANAELRAHRERAELVPGAGLSLSRVGDLEADIRLTDPSRSVTLGVTVELVWRVTTTYLARKVTQTNDLPPVRVSGVFTIKAVGPRGPAPWFTSKHLRATGQESGRVKRILVGLQAELDELEKGLASRRSYEDELRGVSLGVGRVKARLGDLETALAADRQASPPVVSEVTIVGLPTDGVIAMLAGQRRRTERLGELWTYCQGRKADATARLLDLRKGIGQNLLKSVFKNYLNWMNAFFSAADIVSIPTSFPDLITLLYPSRVASALDKPRGLLESWTTAIDDASILSTQMRAIRLLEQTERFFQERMQAAASERAALFAGIHKMQPGVERVEKELKAVVQRLKLVRSSAL
jgi:hypothetical protein